MTPPDNTSPGALLRPGRFAPSHVYIATQQDTIGRREVNRPRAVPVSLPLSPWEGLFLCRDREERRVFASYSVSRCRTSGSASRRRTAALLRAGSWRSTSRQ